MSMRYCSINDYGLVLNNETMKMIASKLPGNHDVEKMGEWDLRYLLYDEGICEYVSEFIGESIKVNTERGYLEEWNCNFYHMDSISYIGTKNYPTLFATAYKNMDELVEEFKDKLGKYLPEDFDYANNIYMISGVYYG